MLVGNQNMLDDEVSLSVEEYAEEGKKVGKENRFREKLQLRPSPIQCYRIQKISPLKLSTSSSVRTKQDHTTYFIYHHEFVLLSYNVLHLPS